MNVECNNCHAKYAVPDDKVKGKKVRITCKRCQSAIIVDGTVPGATGTVRTRQGTMVGGLQAPAALRAEPPPSAPPPPVAVEPWTVALTEEDQREMTTPQVVDAYLRGLIKDDTFIWREGMDDWLTAFEIPEIAAGLKAKGLAPPSANVSAALGDEEEATVIGKSPLKMPSGRAQGAWREPGKWSPAHEKTAPAGEMFDDITVSMAAPKAQELLDAIAREAMAKEQAVAEAPKLPVPAANMFDEDEATVVADSSRFQLASEEPAPQKPRPAAGRPPEQEAPSPPPPSAEERLSPPPPSAQARVIPKGDDMGFDLFRDAATAGNEEESVDRRSGSGSGSLTPSTQQPLTGARNESSVLFSLDSLTKKGPTPPSPKKKDDKVTADMLLAPKPSPIEREEEAPPSIANLGTGGMFGASFGTPELTAEAPPSVAPPPGSAEAMLESLAAPPPKGKSRAGLWVTLALLAAAGVGGGLFYVGQMKKAAPGPEPLAAAVTPKPEPSPPPPAVTVATAPTAVEPVGSAGLPSSAASTLPGASAPIPATAPVGAAAPAPAARATGATTPAAAAPAGAKTAAAPTTAASPAAAAPTAPAEAAPAAADGPPFNKDAASSALAEAVSTAQASCPAPEGNSGSGKVSVTFVNSGRATRTIVTGDLSGTDAGGCVAKIFGKASVPPFAGEPVRVTKSVKLQ